MIYEFNPALQYLSESIRDIKPLSRNETKELLNKYQSGDLDAGSELVRHNMKFIIKICAKYVKRYNQNYDDLIGEGIKGLYHAADKFELDRNLSFLTYAGGWIARYIGVYVIKQRQYDKVNKKYITMISIDEELPHDKHACLSCNPPEIKILTKRILKQYIDNLPPPENLIFYMRFGLNNNNIMKLEDIGKKIGVTKQYISFIIIRRLKIMRRNKKLKQLI